MESRNVYLFLAICLLFLPLAFSNCSTTTTSSSIGDEVYLKWDGDNILVGKTNSDLSKAVDVIMKKDSFGLNELIFSGRVYFVEDRTKAKILGYKLGQAEVRFLDGKAKGKSGWILSEYTNR